MVSVCTFSDSAKQTGLFLACHSVCQQICMDSEVDIFETVKLIRNDQPMFISTVVSYHVQLLIISKPLWEFSSTCIFVI